MTSGPDPALRSARAPDAARVEVNLAMGERVSDALREAGRSQADLARTLGLDPSAVLRRLKGLTPWRLDEVHVIARWLDMDVAQLLTPDEAVSA